MTHEIAFSLGHDLLTFVSSAVIAVMALFMLGVGVPRAPQWKAYRRMRAMLAVAYMLLAASGFATSMVQLEEGSPEWLSAVTLVVASLQALMFTATTVAFVSPLSVGLRWLLPQFLGITVCGAALIGTLACMPSLQANRQSPSHPQKRFPPQHRKHRSRSQPSRSMSPLPPP